jgi:6-phosphofructo-2-kinase/fructose-2,6-biphosphatase
VGADGAALAIRRPGCFQARGKSIVAEKLERFLAWRGWRTQAFSAGARRRAHRGAGSASFFEKKSDQAGAREQVATLVLEEALGFFDSGGEIAILDASNCTLARRRSQAETVAAHSVATGKPIALVCVECIVETPTLLLQNMLAKVRASPDFESTEQTAAMDDLRKRCEIYERTYEGCSEAEGPFIKLWDLGSRCAAYNIYGRMSATILPYILALHLRPRNIYLVSVPDEAHDADGKAAKELCARLGQWATRLAEPLHVICSTDASATEVCII